VLAGRVTVVLVPFHQDERLPDSALPVPADIVVDPALTGAGWPRLVGLWSAVAAAVARVAAPVVVSGDCLAMLGVLTGVQRAGVDPAVVWFDAHGDVHTLETSTSGYLGGLSLRLLMGAHAELVAEPLGLRPLPESRALLVDARDLDPAELDYLGTSAVTRCPVRSVASELPPGPLILHLDLDVIDPAELPGLRFPAPGGPSTVDVLAAAGAVLATGRVVALSLAGTWHPGAPVPADLLTRLAAMAG
jgi:arginase